MSLNGKHGGNGMLLNPLGIINDGLIEMLVLTSRKSVKELVEVMDKAVKLGGTHGYDKSVAILRGKTMKFVCKRENP